jgi:hypothetical protein
VPYRAAVRVLLALAMNICSGTSVRCRAALREIVLRGNLRGRMPLGRACVS